MLPYLDCFETVLLAELRLGLSPLFYNRLMENSDDWGFVLKFHSFFEGAITKLLEEKLRTHKGTHESMTSRDSFVSRVLQADRLGLLEPDYRSFLIGLNRLRNDITHNLRFIEFDFRAYVDGLSDKDFRRTAAALCIGFKNAPVDDSWREVFHPQSKMPNRSIRTGRELFWHLSPRATLWFSGVGMLDLISLQFLVDFKGDIPQYEEGIEARLQDLLLDPAVIEFKRNYENLFPK